MTRGGVCVLADTYPERSQTFVINEVAALRRLGFSVQIEAGAPARERGVVPADADVPTEYLVSDRRRVADLAWLMRHAPRACLADLHARRRWRLEEPVPPLRELAPIARRLRRADVRHLHAHFAAGAALHALRLGRLLGLPYSVTAHGYDIFREPRNLVEKLTSAAFATTGSDYTLDALRTRLAGRPARLEKIVMGVDGDCFQRTTPPAAGGHVLAVGRLVEKKGFDVLVEAAARLADDPVFADVTIVGDGPERERLVALVRARGLEDRVQLPGAADPGEVREHLERAAVLAVPSRVARDGDAESMPVVAKEALAMEVCVVASDVAGLPEVVRPPWGTLVAPDDAAALAAALRAVLQAAPAERARAAAAGRALVVGELGLMTQTARLAWLIDDANVQSDGYRAETACDQR